MRKPDVILAQTHREERDMKTGDQCSLFQTSAVIQLELFVCTLAWNACRNVANNKRWQISDFRCIHPPTPTGRHSNPGPIPYTFRDRAYSGTNAFADDDLAYTR